jgi:hypothetical protein
MSLQQMRERLGRTPSTSAKYSGPSRDGPQKFAGLDDLRLGLTFSELRTYTTLESCSSNSNHEITCSTPLKIGDLRVNAELTFANDHLVRVLCIFPYNEFDGVLQNLMQKYGNPHWTDLGTMIRSWAGNGIEVVLLPSFPQGPPSFLVKILKSYQAEVRARNAKSSGAIDSGQSGETSLRETVDWLKEKIRLASISTVLRKTNARATEAIKRS